MAGASPNQATQGIVYILVGMLAISLNDVLVKSLSDAYPLHQIVGARSGIGIFFSLIILQYEGGFGLLRTDQPWWHLLRCLMIITANMTYFAAIAVIPLADVTALFFVAPLFITLLSIPLLGEKVGRLRLGAVLVGFIGVVIMQRPWADSDTLDVNRIVLLLPVLAALTYAMNQILTRKLGAKSKASALSIYIQGGFIVVSLVFYVLVGDGRYAVGTENPSLQFLLRAWVWPSGPDLWVFVGLGINSALIGFALSQAYRIADAATVAPYEYLGLPLAVLWGYTFFAELPDFTVWIGIALILGSGLFVYFRERQKAKAKARLSPM